MELRIETSSRGLSFDTELKLSTTHKFIFNFAKERNGFFDRRDYAEHLGKSDLKPKMQEKMLLWNQTTLTKLEKAGYIKSCGAGKYELVGEAIDWAERPKPRPDFELGKYHIKMLSKNADGILKSADLKREHKAKPQHEYNRQAKIIDGMVRNLVANEYLERTETGCYKLTKNAIEALNNDKLAADNARADTLLEATAQEPQRSESFKFGLKHYMLCSGNNDGFIGEITLKHKSAAEFAAERDKALAEIDRRISWLCENRYLEYIDKNTLRYTVRGMASLMRCPPDMNMEQHKLMLTHKGDFISVDKIKTPVLQTYEKRYAAAESRIDTQLAELVSNGFLQKVSDTGYKLTESGRKKVWALSHVAADRAQAPAPNKSVKITAFDRYVLEVADEKGYIRNDFIDAHERGGSISKRIKSLEECGLIVNGRITAAFEERVKLASALSRSNKLTLDLMTKEQKLLLKDMRLFLNLTPQQIMEHIYNGNTPLYKRDLELLIRHKLIKLMPTQDIYVLDKNGVNMSNMLLPDVGFYKSKVYSRPDEVGHDVLVYTAYKNIEKQIMQDGGKIIEVKNDRMLRSEDAKLYGHMKGKGEYPDLRIIYKNKYGLKRIHNLEVDCGYDARTINDKLSAFFSSSGAGSFTWCCNSIRQAAKVAKVADGSKSKALRKHKPLYITYMDGSGNIKKMKWS